MNHTHDEDGESTRSVHGGENFDLQNGSVTAPIYETSTFGFRLASEMMEAVEEKSGRGFYSRWSNPTVRALEQKIATLERTEDAVAFSSGMAAISTTLFSFLTRGDHIIAQRSLYGETFNFVSNFLPQYGVEVSLVETCDYSAIEKNFRKNTKLVYIETPTNPTLRVVDLKKVSDIVGGRSIVAVDSTFGSPINQKPSTLGTDLVIHSATKYLGGHSDVISGVVAGSKEHSDRIRMKRRMLGGTIDPLAAWLVIRGIKTLDLRVRRQNENAMALASYLSERPEVGRVNYPGLEPSPDYAVARKQMAPGFGGVLSFELKNQNIDSAKKIVERLRLGTLGASLGSVETLVIQPAATTHHQLTPEERSMAEISDTLIRVSVGIEDQKDLIRDFKAALDSLQNL